MTENIPLIKSILLNAFPKALEADVKTVMDLLPLNPARHNLSESYTIKLNNDLLSIPYRIYFDEPGPFILNKLTHTQKTIVHCIYLRHHNGYLRQRHLEALVGANEFWIVPFTLQLLGEYVLEILHLLNDIITEENIHHYKQFIKDNPIYWQQTISRMISYWHCYYREKSVRYVRPGMFAKLSDYPGKKIVNRII